MGRLKIAGRGGWGIPPSPFYSFKASSKAFIIQPKFETLATQLNSKGEECYDEHAIAEALGLPFRDLKDISRRLEKANEISDTGISVIAKAGFSEREVESAILVDWKKPMKSTAREFPLP